MFVQGYHIVIILECRCQNIFRNKTLFCTFAMNQIKSDILSTYEFYNLEVSFIMYPIEFENIICLNIMLE